MIKLIKYIFCFFAATVLAVLFFLWVEKKDYTNFGLKLERVVTSVLVDSGIGDTDIVHQYQREKKKIFRRWVEITREIKIPTKCDVEKLKNQITGSIKKVGAEIYSYSSRFLDKKEVFEYTFGKDKKVFQKLILHTSPDPDKIKVAIVIDDLGYETKKIDEFIALKIPITFAVLPKERYSKFLTEKIKKYGYPYLLHLPLEPETYPRDNPGKAALLVNMSKQEIKKKFIDNINSVTTTDGSMPEGINNHMGSRFTANIGKMRILISLIKEKNLFFFDSYTTPKTVGKIVANESGVPYLRNDVFLDVEDNPEKIEKQCKILLKRAQEKGYATAIGHIQRKHLVPVLRKYIPRFEEKNCEFVFLTDLL